jgi:hypothetical protein
MLSAQSEGCTALGTDTFTENDDRKLLPNLLEKKRKKKLSPQQAVVAYRVVRC